MNDGSKQVKTTEDNFSPNLFSTKQIVNSNINSNATTTVKWEIYFVLF